jgi:protein-S-isoprenylcysteine O-methyltransferase Ste14
MKISVSPFLLWSIVGIIYFVAFLVAPDIEVFRPVVHKSLLFIFATFWIAWMVWCLIVNRQKLCEAGCINKLIKSGPYAIVRHPIYLADLMAIFVIFGAYPRLWFIAGSFLVIPLVIFWAKNEEVILVEKFGDEYRNYAKRVNAFNPFPCMINALIAIQRLGYDRNNDS